LKKGEKSISNPIGKSVYSTPFVSQSKLSLNLPSVIDTLGGMYGKISDWKFDSKGNATKSEITVYEANLKQFMTDVNVSGCTETSNLQTKEYIIAAQRNDLDSMIAADAGHEAVHSSDKTNLKERYENAKQNKNNDVEAEPERIETIILQQLNAIK
jgi:beta-mannanase